MKTRSLQDRVNAYLEIKPSDRAWVEPPWRRFQRLHTPAIEKGSVVVVTKGTYSDYEVLALCECVESFDLEMKLEKYLDKYPKEREPVNSVIGGFNENKFFAFLLGESGGLREIENSHELYLGDYSQYDAVAIKSREID